MIKPTEIKFKDVAHLYQGCKVITPGGIGTLDAVDSEICMVSYPNLPKTCWNLDSIKPLLLKYNDLTDEQKEKANINPADLPEHEDALGYRMFTLIGMDVDLFRLLEKGEAVYPDKIKTALAEIRAKYAKKNG